MSDIKKNIILLLVVIAVGLGFAVYRKNHPSKNQTSQTTQATSQSQTEEQKLLIIPGPNASKEEVDAHNQLAAKLAQVGTEIEVGNCQSKPIVLQIQNGANLTLKNTSSLDDNLTFDTKTKVNVVANKSLVLKVAFEHGPGLYGYRCKNGSFEGISGFVLVSP